MSVQKLFENPAKAMAAIAMTSEMRCKRWGLRLRHINTITTKPVTTDMAETTSAIVITAISSAIGSLLASYSSATGGSASSPSHHGHVPRETTVPPSTSLSATTTTPLASNASTTQAVRSPSAVSDGQHQN
jgi:hypothetical protein